MTSVLRLARWATLACALCLSLPVLAQATNEPTLREVPAGVAAKKHLVQTIYENVKFPATALEARRGGAYALTIYVNEEGTTFKAKPYTEAPSGKAPLNLVVTAADNTGGAPVSGQMKVNADRALLEQTETIGRLLVDKGFDATRRDGVPVADSVNLVLYYRIE